MLKTAILAAAAAIVTTGAAAPALAQVPATTGPYYVIDGDENQMVAAAAGTRQRRGAIATITVLVIFPDDVIARDGVGRMDMAYEYRCGGTDYRSTSMAMYTEQGAQVYATDDDSEWQAVTAGSPNDVVRAYACDGTPPMDDTAPDIATLFDFYRYFLRE